MDADVHLLARLVGDVDAFAAEHWGRRPLHRASGDTFHDLLDVDEVERLLLSAARRPTFRLVRDGATLPPDRSTTAVRVGGTRLDDVADVMGIAGAVDGGATLVLQGLQRTSLPLARFCRSLERATSHAVQANAYLTPAGAAGLARHHDDHDVLVLQVDGRKAWKVDDLGALETAPGDVLYIPARTAHAAEAQDEASLHLTVGILRVTHGAALRRALDELDALELDRPLPLGYARPEHADRLADALASTLSSAARALADVDRAALVASERRRAATRRLPLPVGQLRSVLALRALDAATIVQVRPDHPATIAPDVDADARIVLELVDRRLRLPAVARPALDRLLDGDTVAVGSLPGIDAESRIVLARRLVREGLLVVAEPGRA